jgi:L-fuconate dehydratase
VLRAIAAGFTHIKMKVGIDIAGLRRAGRDSRRDLPERFLMVDAIKFGMSLKPFRMDGGILNRLTHYASKNRPVPDAGDVLGHAAIARGVAPVGVATGEHVQNRIMFKRAPSSECHFVLSNRCLSCGWGQRSVGDYFDGGQIWCAGLSACGWGWFV